MERSIFIVIVIVCGLTSSAATNIKCSESKSENETVIDGRQTACKKDYDACMFIKSDESRGCYTMHSSDSCGQECILQISHIMGAFCCCTTDYCNDPAKIVDTSNGVSRERAEPLPTITPSPFQCINLTGSGHVQLNWDEEIPCASDEKYCFVNIGGHKHVVPAGCAKTSTNCSSVCRLNDAGDCCCTSVGCNISANVSAWINGLSNSVSVKKAVLGDSFLYAFIVVGAILFLAVVALLGAAFARYKRHAARRRRNKLWMRGIMRTPSMNKEATTGGNNSVPFVPIDLGAVETVAFLERGRFGEVYLAHLNDDHKSQQVVVKKLVDDSVHRRLYMNERWMLTRSWLQHESVVRLLGWGERNDDARSLWLVFEYAAFGPLCSYLRANELTLDAMVQLSMSLVEGVAFLHSSVPASQQQLRGLDGVKDQVGYREAKPVIVHRDLNSHNVLVSTSHRCVIADFGLSLAVDRDPLQTPLFDGDTGDQSSVGALRECGTLRYMAPEVLEGAVNLIDCEEALKQIDMYAVGLLLWEMMLRCGFLYPENEPIPAYEPPFERELHGVLPELERMRELVCDQRVRPWCPSLWITSNEPVCKLLVLTLHELWDEDADARISSPTALNRLKSMADALAGMKMASLV